MFSPLSLSTGRSSSPTLVVLGLLGGTVIATALVSDLFVLPALLTHFGGVPRESQEAKA